MRTPQINRIIGIMVKVSGNVKGKGNASESNTRTRPAGVPPPRASGRVGKAQVLTLPDLKKQSSATSIHTYIIYIVH